MSKNDLERGMIEKKYRWPDLREKWDRYFGSATDDRLRGPQPYAYVILGDLLGLSEVFGLSEAEDRIDELLAGGHANLEQARAALKRQRKNIIDLTKENERLREKLRAVDFVSSRVDPIDVAASNDSWEKLKQDIERMSIDDYAKYRGALEARRRAIFDPPFDAHAEAEHWKEWHMAQQHEDCGVCDELKTKKSDEYYVAQVRRYSELLAQVGLRQCADPACWCDGFGHRIDGQPWDAKDREAIEATIELARRDKERQARICEAASMKCHADQAVAAVGEKLKAALLTTEEMLSSIAPLVTQCDCGGPPGHVPLGINCRK